MEIQNQHDVLTDLVCEFASMMVRPEDALETLAEYITPAIREHLLSGRGITQSRVMAPDVEGSEEDGGGDGEPEVLVALGRSRKEKHIQSYRIR